MAEVPAGLCEIKALDSTNQTFLQLATATLGQFQERAQGDLKERQLAVDALVQPIKESLTKVDGKLGDLERTRIEAYSSLNEQLRNLVETALPQIQKATTSLANAMRQPTVRGRWGELLAVNAQEVAQLGRQLYERVGSLATHWSDVGDKLEKAVGAYNRSVGALETHVLVTARKFVDLEAATADDGALETPKLADTLPRPLVAPDLALVRETGGALERSMRVS